MKSTKFLVGASLASAILLPAPAAAQTAPQAQSAQQAQAPNPAQLRFHTPKVSQGAAKEIKALQVAVSANNAAAIPQALAAAQAAAKTPGDRYFVALMQLKAAETAKDEPAVASALEALAASGDIAPDEQLGLYNALGQTYLRTKQYAKAADAYQHVVQLQPNSVDALASLAEARISAGQAKEAVPLLRQGIKMQQANGQKAPESWYKRAVQVAYKAQLPEAMDLSREWVQAYPTPANWHDAIAIYLSLAHPDAEGTLDLLRLMNAVGGLQTPADYELYANAAEEASNFNEAKAILDKGFTANVIQPSDATVSRLVSGYRARTLATEATLTEASGIAKEALPLVHIGDRFVTLGDYDKAIAAYHQALGRPGADPNLVNLHIGMALARKGDTQGAATALKSVSGPLSGTANLWLTYVATRP